MYFYNSWVSLKIQFTKNVLNTILENRKMILKSLGFEHIKRTRTFLEKLH